VDGLITGGHIPVYHGCVFHTLGCIGGVMCSGVDMRANWCQESSVQGASKERK